MNIVACLGAIITCTMKVGKGGNEMVEGEASFAALCCGGGGCEYDESQRGFFLPLYYRGEWGGCMQHAFYDGRTFYNLINTTCATGMASIFHSWCGRTLKHTS